jgi:hypothetical protein
MRQNDYKKNRVPLFKKTWIWQNATRILKNAHYWYESVCVCVSMCACVFVIKIFTNYTWFHITDITFPKGHGLLIYDDSWLQSDSPHSVRFLWVSDQTEAETIARQITKFTADKHPPLWWGPNKFSYNANERSTKHRKATWNDSCLCWKTQIIVYADYALSSLKCWGSNILKR